MEPFEGHIPCEDEEQQRDAHVGGGHVDPDLEGEGRHEGEEVGGGLLRLGEQDGDACKGFRVIVTPLQ